MANKVDMSLEDIIKMEKVNAGGRRGSGVVRGGVRGRGSGVVRGGMRGRGSGVVRGRGSGVVRGGMRGRGSGVVRGGVRGRGSGGRGQAFEQKGDIDGIYSQDISPGNMGTQHPRRPAKLFIANLHSCVTDSDIVALFSEFGAMKDTAIHHDSAGKSLGSAHVVFKRAADALRALKQYNGIALDGQPMNITILGTSPANKGTASYSGSQNFPKRNRGTARDGASGRGLRGNTRGNRGVARGRGSRGAARDGTSGGGLRGNTRGNRGVARGRGSGGAARDGASGRGLHGKTRGNRGSSTNGRVKRVPTLQELDNELDVYQSKFNK